MQHRKLLSPYRHFGSSLKRCNPKLESLKVFDSDDEENIVTAFLAESFETVIFSVSAISEKLWNTD